MAALYPMDTPERLLKRVQQLEDVELPSLPSFQHDDIDYDDTEESSEGSIHDNGMSRDIDMATPHPLRKSFLPPSSSRSNTPLSESSAGSPFPPLPGSRDGTPSPYVPTTALTSTPHTVHAKGTSRGDETRTTARYTHSRTHSGNTGLGSSTATGREKWQTPGELSQSFSGDEIPVDHIDQSVGLNDQVDSDQSMSDAPEPTQTPFSRRLSSGNVVITRRGKRSVSNTFQPLQPLKEVQLPSPIASGSEPQTPTVQVEFEPTMDEGLVQPPLGQDRVPSLSRSDLSTEHSETANTPPGPVRNAQIATPRERLERGGSVVPSPARRIDWNELAEDEEATEEYTDHEDEGMDSDGMMHAPSLGSMLQPSPAKGLNTPGPSTPGVARLTSPMANSDFMPTPRAPLQEASSQNTPAPYNPPFTPSPGSATSVSKLSDVATPRAPLNDAERRKSHVLAVLGSTGVPARTFRTVKGTPHPLRRVSMAPTTDSISEDSPKPQASSSPVFTPRRATYDQSYISAATGNESFVSVASSADLTLDRRATTQKLGLSRGNTSFPTILLPNQSSGTSVRLGDQRADGIKIHKHLNAMNKQLLESNADLAREAEAWQGEAQRLIGLLQDAGVEVEEFDIAAQVPKRLEQLEIPDTSGDSTHGSKFLDQLSAFRRRGGERESTPTPNGGESFGDMVNHMSKEEQQAILEEMAERLEQLEMGLDGKDQIIAELEDRLAQGQAPDDKAELEQQVESLRQELEEAEKAKTALHEEFATKTKQHAEKFGDICAGFQSQIADLEERLKTARSASPAADPNAERLEDDLRAARAEQSAALAEVEQLRSQLEVEQGEKDDLVNKAQAAEENLREMETRLAAANEALTEVEDLQARLDSLSAERENNEETTRLEQLVKELEQEISERDAQLMELDERFGQLESEMQAMERDDKAAEEELLAEVERLNTLLSETNSTLASKEAELETAKAQLDSVKVDEEGKEAVEVMEAHLEEAFKEIGRLKQQNAASPHLKSTLEQREIKIQALEREKAALQDRLGNVREGSSSSAMVTAGSPFKATPFVNRALASLRMPKTPGTLAETTVGDANEPILRAQIDHLQGELDNANGQLDSNFSRLEEAGLSGLRLAEELAMAQQRISELEDELRTLAQRNTASLALLSEEHERGREGDARYDQAMAKVHQQMEDLQNDIQTERARLMEENARLTAMVSELRRDHAVDLQAVRAEADKEIAAMENASRRGKGELTSAQRERDGLKRDVQALELKLRDAEIRLKAGVAADQELQSVEANLRKVKAELSIVSRERDILRELLDVEARLTKQQADYETLSRKINTEETDALRQTLGQREESLRKAETKIEDLLSERRVISEELKEFERELQVHQAESESFGIELKKLKREQEGKDNKHAKEVELAQREVKRVREEMHRVRGDLEHAQRANRDLARNTSDADVRSALEEQKAKFKIQTQELGVQIRYLKAKFTRESSFRNGLSLQKRYLLLLVGGMSLTEQATLKQIASMGFPVPPPPRKARTFKAVAIAVTSLIRARNSAAAWKAEKQVKAEAVKAREERRRIST